MDMFSEKAQAVTQTGTSAKVVNCKSSNKKHDASNCSAFKMNINIDAIKPNDANFHLTRDSLIERVLQSSTPTFLRTHVYSPFSNSENIAETNVVIPMELNSTDYTADNLPPMAFAQLPEEVPSPHFLPKPKNQQHAPDLAEWERGKDYWLASIWIPRKAIQADTTNIEVSFKLRDPAPIRLQAPYGHLVSYIDPRFVAPYNELTEEEQFAKDTTPSIVHSRLFTCDKVKFISGESTSDQVGNR